MKTFFATESHMLSRMTRALCSARPHLHPFPPGHGDRKKVERGVLKVAGHTTGQWPTILINRHISRPRPAHRRTQDRRWASFATGRQTRTCRSRPKEHPECDAYLSPWSCHRQNRSIPPMQGEIDTESRARHARYPNSSGRGRNPERDRTRVAPPNR